VHIDRRPQFVEGTSSEYGVDEAFYECGALVAATPKDNSQRAWSKANRRWTSGKRQIIERVINQLKDQFFSGAPQGKDPWWPVGSLGSQDRCLA
jgi:hypothetical protein